MAGDWWLTAGGWRLGGWRLACVGTSDLSSRQKLHLLKIEDYPSLATQGFSHPCIHRTAHASMQSAVLSSMHSSIHACIHPSLIRSIYAIIHTCIQQCMHSDSKQQAASIRQHHPFIHVHCFWYVVFQARKVWSLRASHHVLCQRFVHQAPSQQLVPSGAMAPSLAWHRDAPPATPSVPSGCSCIPDDRIN